MPPPVNEHPAPSVDVPVERSHIPRSKRFHFKRKVSGSNEHDEERARRQRSRHHHKSKRRKFATQLNDDASAYDDSAGALPPDAAFRESLFDALGDDEGAAYWQGVYGQPIHNYSDTYRNEETGELEKMDDEAYAQYVRRKMWEKSWEGIEAAREESRREREKEKSRIREEERSGNRRAAPKHEPEFVFDVEFDKSLRRGEARRAKRRWKELWENYLRGCKDLQTLYESRKDDSARAEQVFLRNKIAWPVESGKRKDVNTSEIKRFIRQCFDSLDEGDDRIALLKSERVRWHPDKIQQRYGFMEIDDNTMKGVTAVFQVFDEMWNEARNQQA